jgi:hypothetical protein
VGEEGAAAFALFEGWTRPGVLDSWGDSGGA